jgi:hypothetical protein
MCSKKAVSIKVRKDIYKQVKKNLLDFSKLDLLVGVPQEKTERDKDVQGETTNEPITNAELMFIHTNGSPVKNIPKRPTIEPTIEENKDKISEKFKTAVNKILNNRGDGKEDLEKLGIWVVNKIKARFGSEELEPNTEGTIKRKGSDRPLIDTGQLRDSITYVTRRKQ